MAWTTDQSHGLRAFGILILLTGALLVLSGCKTTSQSTYAPVVDGVTLSGKEARTLHSGKKAFAKNNYGLAQKKFQRATDLNPNNSAAWLGLAAAYDKLGEFDRADSAYQQVVRLRGTTALVLNNMAYSQLLRGDKAAALKLLQQAKRLAPENRHITGNMILVDKTA